MYVENTARLSVSPLAHFPHIHLHCPFSSPSMTPGPPWLTHLCDGDASSNAQITTGPPSLALHLVADALLCSQKASSPSSTGIATSIDPLPPPTPSPSLPNSNKLSPSPSSPGTALTSTSPTYHHQGPTPPPPPTSDLCFTSATIVKKASTNQMPLPSSAL